MSRAASIALIEFCIIVVMVAGYFTWWKPQQIDRGEYERLTEKIQEQDRRFERFQAQEKEKINALRAANDSLLGEIEQRQNQITQNNEELEEMVHAIRSTSLDSVTRIFTGQHERRPEGY